jgi:hypothetical protein
MLFEELQTSTPGPVMALTVLVPGFSPGKPDFDPRPFHVRSVVYKVTPG